MVGSPRGSLCSLLLYHLCRVSPHQAQVTIHPISIFFLYCMHHLKLLYGRIMLPCWFSSTDAAEDVISTSCSYLMAMCAIVLRIMM